MSKSMARRIEPWQTAEIPGPKKALLISKAEIVSALLKRSKKPILIVGHKAAEIKLSGGSLIDYIIRIANLTNALVVSTPTIQSEFIKRNFREVTGMPAVDIANRLTDAEWKGFNGEGKYDLAVTIGFTYYVGWLILSSLKHFSSGIKTVSLDRYYQPHASWSFPNMNLDEWEENLKMIIKGLEVK